MNLQQSGTQFIILNSHTYEFEFTYLWIYIWIQNIYIYNSESIHIYIYTWIQFSWFYMIISYVNSYDLMNSYRVWIHTCEFIFIWSFHIWGIKFIWFMSSRWLLSNFSRSSWNLFQVVLVSLVQVGNGIELEAVGSLFEPYLWRPCGVTWESSQTVVAINCGEPLP